MKYLVNTVTGEAAKVVNHATYSGNAVDLDSSFIILFYKTLNIAESPSKYDNCVSATVQSPSNIETRFNDLTNVNNTATLSISDRLYNHFVDEFLNELNTSTYFYGMSLGNWEIQEV